MDELIEQNTKVDAIITDLPYGTTRCKWDFIIPFDKMWKRIKLLRNDNTPILLFGTEPFSSLLRISNMKEYKYDWYMKKSKPQNFLNAKIMPLKDVETISVFYKKKPIYQPQGVEKIDKIRKNTNSKINNSEYISGQNGGGMKTKEYFQEFSCYPRQVIEVSSVAHPVHETQKPLDLLEYLIKTYTLEGDIVLDFTMGSGTTGVACKKLQRRFIGIELDEKFYHIAEDRIEKLL